MATVDLKMWIQALLVLFFIPLSTTNLLQDDVGDVQDILFDELLRLDPLFGVEGAQSDGLQKVNRNPLVGLNLFKRDGCSLTLDGNVYTCTESANICCTDPNNSQSGWCCPNTAGCGPNDGTLGTCTIRFERTTETVWETSYTTDYETYTSSVGGYTEWATSTTTDYITVSAEMETETEWVTVTIASAQAGKRGAPVNPTTTPPIIDGIRPLPCFTSFIPTATVATTHKPNKQEVIKPKVTEAPLYIQIRGLLIPRQTMRTTTYYDTVSSTYYITTTYDTTVYETTTDFSTDWTTITSTSTAALNAETTMTSTTTQYIEPTESTPINSQTPTIIPGPGENKGLSSGERAGIGVGAGAGALVIAGLIGFFIRRRRRNREDDAAAIAAVASPQHVEYKPPMPGQMSPTGTTGAVSPPPGSDPRYSQMTLTSPPQYGMPSPGMNSGQYPPHYAQYQYPRPPSAMHGVASPGTPMSGGLHSGQVSPSEMPAVYSPRPQR